MILAKGGTGFSATPLAAAPERPQYIVQRVTGPDQRRLCEMGLVEGTRLAVLHRSRDGMMVVKVGGSRLALARGMADSVWVT